MLQLIRDHATGWIAWGIVILISVPFALWGIYDYLSPSTSVAVATVNGTELTFAQYQQAHLRHRNRLRQLLGGQIDLGGLDEGLIRKQALETMIQDELLVQAAISDGFRVGDEQLVRAVHAQAPFQVDGKFDIQRYEGWLRGQGYSLGGFEYELRRSLLTEQILSGVGGSAFITDAEKQRVAKLLGQKRSFFTLTIPLSRFADAAVSEELIERHYHDNQASLITPEAVSIEYVELVRDGLARDIEISDDDLRALYKSSELNFTQPERREASHMLLRIPEGADESAIAQILADTQSLRARVVGGEEFAVLAKEHSQDPGSAINGGSLGFFERGDMVPVFEEVAFSLQIGEVSEVVQSKFGLHIINLTGIQEARTRTFDEAREEVEEEFRRNQDEQLYYEQLDQMEILAFEIPDTLEGVATELGLEVKKIPSFTRSSVSTDPIAANAKVLEVAFSEDVSLAGNNSSVVALPNNRAIVLRVVDHEPSRAQTLDEARASIIARLRDEQARAGSLQLAEEAITHLNTGESRESVAQRLGIEWVPHTEIDRYATSPVGVVVEKVFELPRPDPGSENYAATAVPNGDQVLIALSAVADGIAQDPGSEQMVKLENELLGDYARSAFAVYVRSLRGQADIVVNEESFER